MREVLASLVLVAAAALAATPEAHPAEQAVQEATQRVVKHTVKRYENLHLLAAYYLLDARRWHEILDWNRDVIADPNLLIPGTVLKITVSPDWKPPFDLDAYVAEYMAPKG